MKINSPKNIALLNALVITIISGVAFLIITVSINQINAISIVIFLAFIFVLSFVFINYSLNTFFSEKIKVIYKTIGRTGPNPDDMKKDKKPGFFAKLFGKKK